jgi:transposase-like protein
MKEEEKEKAPFDFSEFEKSAISGLQSGQPLFGEGGILKQLVKHLVEASIEGELDHHLQEQRTASIANKRNGKGRVKTVRSSVGNLEIQSMRDRRGDFEPVTVGKWDREIGAGFEEQILELYAMGNSQEDISLHLFKMYGTRLSKSAISAVTDRVWDQVKAWQERPLLSLYVLLYLDAIHYKVREEGRVITKAIYTIYGVDADGQRDILSVHIGPNEGAHQWSLYLEELKRRGMEDVLFFAVDGLTGFSEAIHRVYPDAIVQRCIVHMIRTSLIGVSDKDRKPIVRDLRTIYSASTESAAVEALEAFEVNWGKRYPFIGRKWRESWIELVAFLDFGPEIRRMIYTTNAVENVHRQMRKVTKTKGAWCTENALLKQLYLSLMRKRKSWARTVFKWSTIQQELIELYGQRYQDHVGQ